MKRTPLVRKAPMRRAAIVRRRKPKRDNRVPELEALHVLQRDGVCIALQYDPSHQCVGRLTLAHVPERGQNALGMKPPSDRYHLVAECYGANSGGLNPWSETHREIERAHLEKLYPGRYES